jgi:hypothetical protein
MAKSNKNGITSKWDGMNPDGYSNQTYAPEPHTTPNDVGGSPQGKKGKGAIAGGIEEPEIFDSISYTGNTTYALTPPTNKSQYDPSLFNAEHGRILPPTDSIDIKANVVGGDAKYAAGNKNDEGKAKKIYGSESKTIAPASYKIENEKHLPPESKFNGKNPNSQNLKNKGNKIPTTVFRGGGKSEKGVNA